MKIRIPTLALALLISPIAAEILPLPVVASEIKPLEDNASLPEALESLLPALMEKHKVPGVSIVGIEGNKIAWTLEKGIRNDGVNNAVTPKTVFEAASMSKPLLAYVALKLVEEGKLDLDRPLSEYLDKPYVDDEPLIEKITARMVLNHTSGLPNWRKKEGLKVLSAPGSRYIYSGEGYLFLQNVICSITGQDFETLMKARLFEPLGMKDSSFVFQASFADFAEGYDNEGRLKPRRKLYREPNAAFSLYCTPSDYAKFLLEIMNPDRSGTQSLSQKGVEEMLTPSSPPKDRPPLKRRDTGGVGPARYGLGWTVEPAISGPRMTHSGSNAGFRCFAEFDPAKGHGLVIMTNGDNGAALWKELINIAAKP